MNPITFISALTSIWLSIPEERREKYVNEILDLVEDLAADARDALRIGNDETEEVK